MTSRPLDDRGVYIGDAPIRDHAGYTVDVGVEDRHVVLKNALDGNSIHGIRTDLAGDQVDDLIERLQTAKTKLQEQK
ncbi:MULTISPECIES: hypothetical protein [Nocardia]|uniref:hypothetical protein n=1 Tax=Nocardia TaxID=1817 RepID=UPI000D6972CC|nr:MULTISPECIES: hypothetical protein [Nocardia]